MRLPVVSLYVVVLLLLLNLPGCDNLSGLGKPPTMEIGKIAPDFELQDETGKVWKLSSLKGKVVFVNFWATWCKPCRDEMPSMEKLNKRLAGKPFQMLSIIFNDDHDLAASFAKRQGATFPVLAGADPNLTQAYMITGVPETFLVDAEGILRHKFIGPYDWNSPEMMRTVMSLFADQQK